MIAGSCAAMWRMPRNRPPAAAIWPSSTASTFGSRRSAKLTMPAQILVLPPRRSASSAMARTNSLSPIGRISSGPLVR